MKENNLQRELVICIRKKSTQIFWTRHEKWITEVDSDNRKAGEVVGHERQREKMPDISASWYGETSVSQMFGSTQEVLQTAMLTKAT